MLDKIFKAYDVRGVYPDQINEDAAWKIGCAAGKYLKDHPEKPNSRFGDTVLVSRDMRKSSPSLCNALIEGIRASGMNVIDLGMADTSFKYFAVNHLDAAGAIQTTASHNPPQYNGFKFSGPQAKPIGAQTGLNDIRDLAMTLGEQGSIDATGSCEEMDLWEEYRKHILGFLAPLTKEHTIFIDGSNGMAGKLVPQVFSDVENLKIIDLNFEITGEFAHDPNPLVAENMIPTQEGVKEHGAQLGACFDGDADRCMITDEKGEIVGCDHLTALLADFFLKKSPGANVVYDLRSSKSVEETVKELGGSTTKSRVGHVFMKAALRETDGVFGGELSGHFYFRDNFFADSGAITLACVLSVLNGSDKPLSELVAPYRKYPQSGEINFQTEDKEAVLAELKETYKDKADIDELDGVTIDCFAREGDDAGWWFNVRASNTEPLLRLNAEAKDQATLDSLLETIKPKLGTVAEGH